MFYYELENDFVRLNKLLVIKGCVIKTAVFYMVSSKLRSCGTFVSNK